MAILYKNGTVLSDYTRFVLQSNGTRIGYIFRLMSNGWILVRPHRAGGRWRRFCKDKKLSDVQMTIDVFLRPQLEKVFD
jgi:hypothetical protein